MQGCDKRCGDITDQHKRMSVHKGCEDRESRESKGGVHSSSSNQRNVCPCECGFSLAEKESLKSCSAGHGLTSPSCSLLLLACSFSLLATSLTAVLTAQAPRSSSLLAPLPLTLTLCCDRFSLHSSQSPIFILFSHSFLQPLLPSSPS